jgi:recombination protein RecT
MVSKAVIIREKVKAVDATIKKMLSEETVLAAMPEHMDATRLRRVLRSVFQENPRLLEANRGSLLSAVMTCAELGLEPGKLGQAYLVPYGGKVMFIPGYKGLISLARNSGLVTSLYANPVYNNDDFACVYGTDGTEGLRHAPNFDDRGSLRLFYAVAHFTGGGSVYEVMTLEDVEKVRDGSDGYKAFKAGKIKDNPWNSSFVQMGRKTLIRRLSNYLPQEVQRAVVYDNAADQGEYYNDATIEGEAEVVEDDQSDDQSDDQADDQTDDQLGPEAEKPAEKKKPAAKKKKTHSNHDNPPEPEEPPPASDGDGLGFGD